MEQLDSIKLPAYFFNMFYFHVGIHKNSIFTDQIRLAEHVCL